MKKGDIVLGEGNKNQNYPINGHPIVFLENNDEYTFVGLMLSSKSFHGKNVPLEESHIRRLDDEGKEFKFKYDNTHLIPLQLLKKNEWEPFTKIGQLSEEGIIFVKEITHNEEPVFWQDALELEKVNRNLGISQIRGLDQASI